MAEPLGKRAGRQAGKGVGCLVGMLVELPVFRGQLCISGGAFLYSNDMFLTGVLEFVLGVNEFTTI